MTTDDRVHLLDVNVLFALAWPQHVHHDVAHAWFARLGAGRFATCPITEAAFVRLSVNPRIVGREVRFADAVAMLARIRSLPNHVHIADGASLAEPAIDLTRGVVSAQVTDLVLVNLAAMSDALLVTFDRAISTYLSESDRDHVLLLDTAGR